jgi:hypothetical protein
MGSDTPAPVSVFILGHIAIIGVESRLSGDAVREAKTAFLADDDIIPSEKTAARHRRKRLPK